MRTVLSAIAFLSLVVAGTVGVALARSGPLDSELQAVRAAVDRYHSYDVASAAGYLIDPVCVSSPAGAMGYHAPNPGLMSGPIDPLAPPILLYTQRKDGSKDLVGVEYFEAALVNTPDGPRPWLSPVDPRSLGMTFFTPPPRLFGQRFEGPMAGHNPEMPWHYDLHAWVVEQNPAGVFAQFNPTLSCG
jgi:hypothetical protein